MATGGEGHSGAIAQAFTWLLGVLSVVCAPVLGWIYSHGIRLRVVETQVDDLRKRRMEVDEHIVLISENLAYIKGKLDQ